MAKARVVLEIVSDTVFPKVPPWPSLKRLQKLQVVKDN
jgi:hypothetical protein